LAVGPEACPRVSAFSIIVVSNVRVSLCAVLWWWDVPFAVLLAFQVFDPEKFGALAQLLAKVYFVTGKFIKVES
jgi:hypothetical protein